MSIGPKSGGNGAHETGTASGAPKATRLRNIVKGVGFLTRRFPRSIALIVAFSILSGVIPAFNAWVGKKIIDDVVRRIQMPSPTASPEILAFWIGAGVALGLLGIFIRWRQALAQDWLQRAGAIEIDRILVDRTQGIDVLTRESPEFADRQMLVQMGTGALSTNLLTSVITIGQTLITMLSFIGILVAFSPALALLGIAVGASFGYVEVRYSKQRYLLSRALIKLRRKVGVTRNLLTNPGIVHEIKRADTYDNLRSRMLDQGREARDREHALERKTHWKRAAVSAAETVISFGVYGGLLWRLLRGAITLGDVTLYRSAFSTISGGVQTMGRAGSSLLESDLQLQHLFEFLEPAEARREEPAAGTAPFPERLSRGIEVRALDFKYPNMDTPALKDVHLDLPPNAITAIVGPNGCGKTTLLKILAGIYPAAPSCVRLEGRPIAEYEAEDYVGHVYMWGIGSYVHPLTVRENVALCRFSESGNDDAVWNAVRQAGAEDIVRRLPGGVETMLTRALDDGQQLSWGQSMRIILARALFADARIILIDEPGTGMDRDARKYLLGLMKELRKDRIVVLASHDPDVIGVADRVVELKAAK